MDFSKPHLCLLFLADLIVYSIAVINFSHKYYYILSPLNSSIEFTECLCGFGDPWNYEGWQATFRGASEFQSASTEVTWRQPLPSMWLIEAWGPAWLASLLLSNSGVFQNLGGREGGPNRKCHDAPQQRHTCSLWWSVPFNSHSQRWGLAIKWWVEQMLKPLAEPFTRCKSSIPIGLQT